MVDIELGGSKGVEQPKKQKVVYITIPATIMLLLDIKNYPNCKRYVDSLSQNILNSLTKEEIKKEIFNLFNVKNERQLEKRYAIIKTELTHIFGDIWGE